MTKAALAAGLIASGLMLQGCISTVVGATAGAAVSVAGAAAGATVKGVGAVGRAVIPGGDEKHDERRR